MNPAIAPPRPAALFGESMGILELPRLITRFPALADQPRGSGERVLVLPGYGAGDASTGVLRSYLRYLGYRARGWGLGRNRGNVEELIPQVIERLEELVERDGEPVSLVGWSLGGVLAREAARERPDCARRVVTMGSPVVGGPKYTAAAPAFRRRGLDLDAVEAEINARNEVAIEVPVTAIYSRNDAVVAWEACIDRGATDVEHVEVEATHVGLGFSPDVFEIVAQRLARD